MSRKEININLRPATREDWSFIKDLAGEAFAVFGPYRRIVSDWLADHFVRTYLLEVEDRPAGFFMLGLMLPSFLLWNIELMAIAVIPSLRGQGLGRFMLTEAEKVARLRGYRLLRAHVGCQNQPALRLFQQAGFQIKKHLSRYYPSGLDAYELIKKLGA